MRVRTQAAEQIIPTYFSHSLVRIPGISKEPLMPSILRKRSTRIVFTATTGLLVATLGFFAWQSFYPVQAAAG